ncbi:hypothetical protein [Blastopirellula retiformator]|uniref:Uncharacterized protein n=1 Tax=Blastopirellula retiformator TaxID=2527970 RepID=A0A5C5VM76_9BACT|nr:hypothetical protein [Blastopirellula retiformator]TWT39090.1 hypothetical protein Enr8_07850 [Blastopirellula retiformator]
MGLALEVGILADLKTADEEGFAHFKVQFDLLNQLLAQNQLPPHVEPEEMPVFSGAMFGYSGLHYLRRVAAHLIVNGAVPEPCVDRRPTDDPVMMACYDEIATMQDARSPEWKRFDHLLCHSDAEGYYVPLEFDEVLFDFEDLGLYGVQAGSSVKLLQECLTLAKALEMPTDLDGEDEVFFDAAESQGEGEGWRRYGMECYSCIHLIQAARHSIEHGAAIVFT